MILFSLSVLTFARHASRVFREKQNHCCFSVFTAPSYSSNALLAPSTVLASSAGGLLPSPKNTSSRRRNSSIPHCCTFSTILAAGSVASNNSSQYGFGFRRALEIVTALSFTPFSSSHPRRPFREFLRHGRLSPRTSDRRRHRHGSAVDRLSRPAPGARSSRELVNAHILLGRLRVGNIRDSLSRAA